MELILKQNVENLGFKDDLVKVKNGYGRNFLIPEGKAILATVSAKIPPYRLPMARIKSHMA